MYSKASDILEHHFGRTVSIPAWAINGLQISCQHNGTTTELEIYMMLLELSRKEFSGLTAWD